MKPRQKKSRTYYYFWGIATLSVVFGQIYVGNGFRRMADSNDGISADINLLVEALIAPSPRTMPVPKDWGGYGGREINPDKVQYLDFYDDNMARKDESPYTYSRSSNPKVFCGIFLDGR